MRSSEAVPGKTYRLRRGRAEVEMLDTPPVVRASHRMRVKFLSGVKAGTVTDIPSVAIAPVADATGSSATQRPPKAGGSSLIPVSGSLRPGANVLFEGDKAEFHWKVERLLPDGSVEIATEIFGRRTTMTVSRERLQLLGRRRRFVSDSVPAATTGAGSASNFDKSQWISKNLSPDEPRRYLDVVADSIVLGPRCLQSCRERFYPGDPITACADRFRSEIRYKGLIQGDRKRGLDKGRIRVHRRFELVLPVDFEAGTASTFEDPSAIIDLRPWSERRKARPKNKSRRSHARRHRRRRKRPPGAA